ncbi:MAG: DUF342 domain-containing protein [Clostridium butyricum]|nr:DUF342 domain-containing protein [Clostridium butyricum]
MDLLFYGKNLDDCLEQASKELNIPIKDLKYKVLKNSGLFNRTTEIKVTVDKVNNEVNDIDNQTLNDNSGLNSTFLSSNVSDDTSEYGIKVEDKKIIVYGNPDNTEKFTIRSCDGINLKINNMPCQSKIPYPVYVNDIVEYTTTTVESHRKMDIRISEDKMSVYATIEYTPEYTYELKDASLSKDLVLRARKKPGTYPKKYTTKELKTALYDLKVRIGIIEEVLDEVCEGTVGAEILVAKGIPQKDDEEDEIKILFNQEEKNHIEADSKEKIDYRNINNLSNVKKGEVLAIKIPGMVGENGSDVFGTTIPKKTLRSKPFKATKGCTLQENKVIATKAGRPSHQNGIFVVNDVYSVNDVDLNTGNINFVGDVEINNNINDGMKVHAKGRLLVRKNITFATASANGPITVNGSIINSNVLAGGYDVEKKIYLENLNKYHIELVGLISALELLIEKSPDRNVGELIKILMDKRFKNITKISMSILTFNISAGIQKSEILDFIRNKLMGLNTFNIKSINELKYFKELVEEEIEIANDALEIPIDISLSYCQNSNIVATGSIFITGKGEYTSKLKAFDTIEFTKDKAVARGGTLNARKCIKLKTVGSDAGVITTLEVEKDGIITADIAYSNTVFCFGSKKKILEVSGKNVKAYVDKDGEIIIEKFVL